VLESDLRTETARLLAELIRIDTTNPPGNETPAAEHLATYLAGAGVQAELRGRTPERANLVARLPGRGDGPTLMLLGHTDVVLADPDEWTVPPFSGLEREGQVWGRGALDMKGQVAAEAVAVAALAREGWRGDGDLILCAVADEEVGDGYGLPWLIEHHPDLVRADYVINEGGGERIDGRKPHEIVALGVAHCMEGRRIFTDLSVEENLRFFAALEGMTDINAKIEDALRHVDLLDRRDSTVNTLSGGMRTRVSLATTLLHQPRLLLLDEPTVGVDPALRREFWEHFRALAGTGVAILVSSHVMDEASRCDRLGLIRAGKVLAEGTARELVARAGTSDLEGAFLALSAAPA